jgi:hypothetical protein
LIDEIIDNPGKFTLEVQHKKRDIQFIRDTSSVMSVGRAATTLLGTDDGQRSGFPAILRIPTRFTAGIESVDAAS